LPKRPLKSKFRAFDQTLPMPQIGSVAAFERSGWLEELPLPVAPESAVPQSEGRSDPSTYEREKPVLCVGVGNRFQFGPEESGPPDVTVDGHQV